jgi:hypothetical protein
MAERLGHGDQPHSSATATIAAQMPFSIQPADKSAPGRLAADRVFWGIGWESQKLAAARAARQIKTYQKNRKMSQKSHYKKETCFCSTLD